MVADGVEMMAGGDAGVAKALSRCAASPILAVATDRSTDAKGSCIKLASQAAQSYFNLFVYIMQYPFLVPKEVSWPNG